jgi:ketosteroid isomerase-like protein
MQHPGLDRTPAPAGLGGRKLNSALVASTIEWRRRARRSFPVLVELLGFAQRSSDVYLTATTRPSVVDEAATLRQVTRENVDLVRSTFEAWGKGDLKRVMAVLDPGIEWQMAEDEPDARMLRGQQEVLDMLGGWVESFSEFSADPQDFIDAGQHVLVPIRFVARPHGADAPVTIEETQVFTVKDGAVVRVHEYRTKLRP